VPVDQADQVAIKETEIGQVPAHWEVKVLGDIAEIQSGGTPLRSRPEYFGGSVPWVKTLDLNESIVTATEELLTPAGFNSIRGKLRPVGTVMVAMYGGAGTIGKSGMLGIAAATNQAVCCIMPNPARFDPAFLASYMVYIRPTWMAYAIGTRKDPNISKGTIERRQVPVPPLEEQRLIVSALSGVDRKLAAEVDQRQALTTLFTSLLDHLMTGKVRAGSASPTVGARQVHP
jgi:type I restriction enzyme S subunit